MVQHCFNANNSQADHQGMENHCPFNRINLKIESCNYDKDATKNMNTEIGFF